MYNIYLYLYIQCIFIYTHFTSGLGICVYPYIPSLDVRCIFFTMSHGEHKNLKNTSLTQIFHLH